MNMIHITTFIQIAWLGLLTMGADASVTLEEVGPTLVQMNGNVLSSKRVNGKTCLNEDFGKAWGVWIDGRNAADGSEAYGPKYTPDLSKDIKKVLNLPQTGSLSFSRYEEIAKLLKVGFGTPHAYCKEVNSCHGALTAGRVSDIKSGIDDTVLRDCSKGSPENHKKFLSSLFVKYNHELDHAKSDHKKILTAIGKLMRNIAFHHPLNDKNGRSRLLLLQSELRRTGLACGTMMYNNNKDIYFETLDKYVKKLEEGIDMYKIAEKSGFTKNPWASKKAVHQHLARFADSEDEALMKCWERHCPEDGKKGGSGCDGTSPLRANHLSIGN